ncbi:MAG: prephenate dehydratase [Candidatus Hydrogenedentes bacterium]|nr:prephenate dehydratase [Candidatus Hydrogenedentota bacterium]
MDELRQRIDDIDAQILRLLNERAQRAVEIGEIKRTTNATCYVPEREKIIYEKLKQENPGPLPDKAIQAIYREVISATRALEKLITVAFLGPRDTFSHMAALRVFGAMAEYHPLATIDDIFVDVERRRVDYGVVPVETAMGGGVSDTLDRFITSDLKIVNEIMLHITQNLLSNSPIDTITKVYSKAQSFVQCRNWLKANLPQAELLEAASTAEAARIAAQEPGAAAIASDLAAETFHVKVGAPGIEDAPHNFTRFFVISHHIAKPTGHDKTAILCSIKDRPGALYALLLPLASGGINLSRIESRPSRKKPWEYVFFIDLLGHCEDRNIKDALEQVAKQCAELKVLGSFPQGEIEE